MSSDAIGWVYRHSPYTGAAFSVHVAVADSCNDQNDDEFWMRQGKLAVKARTTRKTVGEVLARMVTDGGLRLLEQGSGGANRYRLIMAADAELVFDRTSPTGQPGATSRGTKVAPHVAPGATPALIDLPPHVAHNPRSNPRPAQADNDSRAAGFAEFWTSYPRKIAKPEGEKAWQAAVVKPKVDPALVLAGLVPWLAYWATRNQPEFVPHPATWLRQQRWNDTPPEATRPATGPRAPIAADRTRPSGRVTDL